MLFDQSKAYCNSNSFYIFRRKRPKTFSHHTSDPLLSDGTRDTDDTGSNYYERRGLATIGRSSARSMRDPIYSERALLNAQNTADLHNLAMKCHTLPPGGAGARQPGDDPYCTCTQGASTLYGRHHAAATRRQTSFVTFKPAENGHLDSYSVQQADRPESAINADTQSLDLIRETESQNLENAHRASLTPNLSSGRHLKCNKCSIPVTICSCRASVTSSTLSHPARGQRDPTMINNMSV